MAREHLSKQITISVNGISKPEVESCLRILVRSFDISSIAIRKSGGPIE